MNQHNLQAIMSNLLLGFFLLPKNLHKCFQHKIAPLVLEYMLQTVKESFRTELHERNILPENT